MCLTCLDTVRSTVGVGYLNTVDLCFGCHRKEVDAERPKGQVLHHVKSHCLLQVRRVVNQRQYLAKRDAARSKLPMPNDTSNPGDDEEEERSTRPVCSHFGCSESEPLTPPYWVCVQCEGGSWVIDYLCPLLIQRLHQIGLSA
jgi:hypothetical protein